MGKSGVENIAPVTGAAHPVIDDFFSNVLNFTKIVARGVPNILTYKSYPVAVVVRYAFIKRYPIGSGMVKKPAHQHIIAKGPGHLRQLSILDEGGQTLSLPGLVGHLKDQVFY